MSGTEAVPEHLLPVLVRLARVLNDRHVNYALIGGLGVALRGPIRATGDIDLLIKIPQLDLPGVLEALVGKGFDLDVMQAIAVWNRDHLLDFARGSVRVDWLKPVLPAFEHILSRARWEHIGDCPVRAADAEGLILLKLIAFRPRDQEDIKGMLAANGAALDLAWIRSESSQLAGLTSPKPNNSNRWSVSFMTQAVAERKGTRVAAQPPPISTRFMTMRLRLLGMMCSPGRGSRRRGPAIFTGASPVTLPLSRGLDSLLVGTSAISSWQVSRPFVSPGGASVNSLGRKAQERNRALVVLSPGGGRVGRNPRELLRPSGAQL